MTRIPLLRAAVLQRTYSDVLRVRVDAELAAYARRENRTTVLIWLCTSAAVACYLIAVYGVALLSAIGVLR